MGDRGPAKFGRAKGANRDRVFTMRFSEQEFETLTSAARSHDRKVPGLIREALDLWFARHRNVKKAGPSASGEHAGPGAGGG
jgi:hypothetical protein